METCKKLLEEINKSSYNTKKNRKRVREADWEVLCNDFFQWFSKDDADDKKLDAQKVKNMSYLPFREDNSTLVKFTEYVGRFDGLLRVNQLHSILHFWYYREKNLGFFVKEHYSGLNDDFRRMYHILYSIKNKYGYEGDVSFHDVTDEIKKRYPQGKLNKRKKAIDNTNLLNNQIRLLKQENHNLKIMLEAEKEKNKKRKASVLED